MSLLKKAVDFIKPFEVSQFNEKHLRPYLDSGGVPTIGWGSTIYENGKRVKISDPPISLDRANSLIETRVEIIVNFINKHLPTLSENQKVALTSLVYNIGGTAFLGSTLYFHLKAGSSIQTIEKNFLRWKYDNGKIVNGLLNRRKKEIELFKKKI